MSACWAGDIDTPLGPMVAGGNDQGLAFLEFSDRPLLQKRMERFEARFGKVVLTAHPILESIRQELAAYFEGKLYTFKTPCQSHGTDFQTRAWSALTMIPYGTRWSYAQQASALGQPKACRAVGTANSANPLAIIVPCHRVVASDGSLGGYAGSLPRKVALLALEAAHV